MANMDHFTGSITTAATSVLADSPACTGAYVVLFGAAHAGITVNFEGTPDGVTWIPLTAYLISGSVASATPAVTSVALGSNSTQQYYVNIGAFNQMRVRSSAYTSGTCSVSIMTVLDADPVNVTPSVSPYVTPAALADSTANPTAGLAGALPYEFNGTTWDRIRNNAANVSVDTSAARTTTGTGATGICYNHGGAYVQVNVTAFSGTTPTLVVRLQGSVDGTNWWDIDATNAATASIVGTGQYIIRVYPGIPTVAAGSCNAALPRNWRCAWTIGGTTPSFTFTTIASYQL